jgi:hypothetical protein
MWRRPFSVADVAGLAARYPRARGVGQLRELLPLIDGGAAAPRESRIRLDLWDNGFPQPETQIPVALGGTHPVAFLDLGWPEYRVAVDCDADAAKVRMLDALGWLVVPVASEDEPGRWLAAVEDALAGRGCFVDVAAVAA